MLGLCKGVRATQAWRAGSRRPAGYSTAKPLDLQEVLAGSAPRVLVSKTKDPFFNKAVEDHLFRSFSSDAPLLYLWQNEPTVFIGRNQNPWKECFVQAMEEDGVHLVRRFSGGGAVYQDDGNLCWSIIAAKDAYSTEDNLRMVCDALVPLKAEPSGRNDITVEGAKVSGSAFKFSGKRCLHHGTLLVDVDLESMTKYLNVPKEKLQSKGVSSVKSRVANMGTLDPTISVKSLGKTLVEKFELKNGAATKMELGIADMEDVPDFAEMHEKLRDWDWRFGQTPKFEHNLSKRFPWGTIDLHVDSDHGKIIDLQIYSDALYPELIEGLTTVLKGVPYHKSGLLAANQQAALFFRDSPDLERHAAEYLAWLETAL